MCSWPAGYRNCLKWSFWCRFSARFLMGFKMEIQAAVLVAACCWLLSVVLPSILLRKLAERPWRSSWRPGRHSNASGILLDALGVLLSAAVAPRCSSSQLPLMPLGPPGLWREGFFSAIRFTHPGLTQVNPKTLKPKSV